MGGPFKTGDKVFAKVRGYPPWPAHVQCLAETTNNKLKYHVIFYGTYETAVCKAEDIFPYAANKERFGKPLKRKGFNEALEQIESGVNDKLFETKYNEESESDWESDFDQTSPESRRASKTSEQINQRDSKSLKSADKSINKKSLNESTSPASQGEAQRVSRSGRKIKPKKFADDEIMGSGINTDNSEHSVRAVGSSCDHNKGNILPNNYTLSNTCSEENAADSEDDQSEICRTSRPQQLPATHKRKSSLQAGTVDDDDNMMFKSHVDLSEPPIQNSLLSIGTTRLSKIKQLQTVSQLLCLDALIKASTCCSKVKLENCLKYLTELANLPVDCNTLKKCPQIVGTVQKLTKYLGNNNLATVVCEGGEITEKIFLIQCKSQQIYNKYKIMFTNLEKDVSSSTYLNNVDYSHRHSFSSENGSTSGSEVFPAVISQPGPSNTVARKVSTRGRKIGKSVSPLSRMVGRPSKFIKRSAHHSKTTDADNRHREDVENWPPGRGSTC